MSHDGGTGRWEKGNGPHTQGVDHHHHMEGQGANERGRRGKEEAEKPYTHGPSPESWERVAPHDGHIIPDLPFKATHWGQWACDGLSYTQAERGESDH